MHRLNFSFEQAALAGTAALLLSCSRPERIPIKNVPIDTGAPVVENDGTKSTPAISTSHNVNNECPSNAVEDLDGMLQGGECDSEPPASYQLNNQLGVKVTLSSPEVASGGKVEVRLVFENLSSKEKLPVYFYRDPKVQFPMLAVNSKGHDQTYPEGGAPGEFTGSIGRVVLAPKGTIKVRLPFQAVHYKWKKVGKSRDLIEAGGLPRGDYHIRIRFPFAGSVRKVYEKYDIELRVK